MRIEPERTWELFQDLVIVVYVPVVAAVSNGGYRHNFLTV